MTDATCQVRIEKAAPEQIVMHLTWQTPTAEIKQRYDLTPGKLILATEVPSAGAVGLTVPLFVTDGAVEVPAEIRDGVARVNHRGAQYRVTFDPAAPKRPVPLVANRNGVYSVLRLEQTGSRITTTFELQRP